MTLVTSPHLHAADGPKTHVLIVAVGWYPELDKSMSNNKHRSNFPLEEELLCAPHSAQAVANWFLGAFGKLARPLGSLEMLVSAKSPVDFTVGNKTLRIERATLSNVANRFGEWFDRCNDDSDNVAVFYFVGHGLVDGHKQLLLLGDFLLDSNRPLAAAVDLDSTLWETKRCAAKTQCYLIDACRLRTTVVEDSRPLSRRDFTVLSSNSPPLNYQNVNRLVLYSTQNGAAAIGTEIANPGATRFARAVVANLEGRGAWSTRQGWRVFLDRLGLHTRETMTRDNTEVYANQPHLHQEPEPDLNLPLTAAPIVNLAAPPTIPCWARCSSKPAHFDAEIVVTKPNSQKAIARKLPNNTELLDSPITPGRYEFIASFASGSSYPNTKIEEEVLPPHADVEIPV